MASFKEEIAKIEELAKEDEQFRNEYFNAVKAQDVGKCIDFLESRGFAAAAEGLRAQIDSGQEIDEAELEAVAGGGTRGQRITEYCGRADAFFCGAGLAVALWSPDFQAD